MNSWLKAAANLGDQVQKHATGLQQNASLLAEGVLQAVDATAAGDVRELTFDAGPLGFVLDGMQVASVDPDGQAAMLGLQVGDRLTKVAGYEVPAPAAPGDEAGERRNATLVKRWLKEMPRPGGLHFSRSRPEVAGRTAETDADVVASGTEAAAAAPASVENKEVSETNTLKAELVALRDLVHSQEAELDQLRDECQELRHLAVEHVDALDASPVGAAQSRLEVCVRTLQEQLADSRADHEASRKKVAELVAHLGVLQAKNEELRSSAAQGEEDVREAFAEREQLLEEEVARLLKAVSATEAKADMACKEAAKQVADATAQEAALQAKLESQGGELRSLRAKATAADLQAEVTGQEVLRIRSESAEDLAKLHRDHEAGLRRLEQRLIEQRQAHVLELSELRRDLEAARQRAARREEQGPEEDGFEVEPPEDGTDDAERGTLQAGLQQSDASPCKSLEEGSADVAALHQQVAYLERKCGVLQKKLDARPIVCQRPPSDGSATPGSDPVLLRRFLGPQLAALAAGPHAMLDARLRRFTQRLLRHGAWLWLFYAHLLVLYAVAASCYAQAAAPDPSVPLDALHAHVRDGKPLINGHSGP